MTFDVVKETVTSSRRSVCYDKRDILMDFLCFSNGLDYLVFMNPEQADVKTGGKGEQNK